MAISAFKKLAVSSFIMVLFSLCNSASIQADQSSEKSSDAEPNQIPWAFYNPSRTFVHFKGDNLTINCSTTDPTDYILLWHKHEMLSAYEIAPDGKRIHHDGLSFILRNLTYQDSGLYTCQAIKGDERQIEKDMANVTIAKPKPNAMTNSSKNFTFTEAEDQTGAVKPSGDKPYIYFNVKSPVRMSISEKKPCNLTATVKGLQPIKVHWLKDQQMLIISNRVKTFDNQRRLVIEPPFVEDDSSAYSVVACNTKGCQIRGIQVLFYRSHLAQISKKKDIALEVMKRIGMFGGLPFLVIFGLVLVALKKNGTICANKTATLKKLGEDLEKQRHRGGGRSASLWSWRSKRLLDKSDRKKYRFLERRMGFKLQDGKRRGGQSRLNSVDSQVLSCENIFALFDNVSPSSDLPSRAHTRGAVRDAFDDDVFYSDESD